jgi:D-alanyl-D-alanine carboxypeptidase
MKKILFYFLLIAGFILKTNAQSFDPLLADRLQNTLDSMRTTANIKGVSACVIYPGLGTWNGVSGISHQGVPITSDLEFGIASNTKLFTGVLILKLAEENLLQLDDPLHEYLPPYNNINPNVTIRQLLNHTSGLDDVTHVPGYPDSMLTDPNRVFTPQELLTWAGPPLFAPGTDWNYCNTNYLLAGLIAESVTGQSYSQLLRERILNPLQMDSTFLAVYEPILFPVAQPWQAGVNNQSIPRTSVNSAAWAAGAMYSTAGEMARWYEALMSGQVINANSFQELTTFVGSGSYGMGIARTTIMGRTVWCHGGQIWGGYNSSMMYDTASGIIISVYINQLPGQAFQIAVQLLSAMVNHPLGLSEQGGEETGIILYPNPSDGYVQWEMPEAENGRFLLSNQIGKRLMSGVITGKEQRISLWEYPPGIYYLTLQSRTKNRTLTIIKR